VVGFLRFIVPEASSCIWKSQTVEPLPTPPCMHALVLNATLWEVCVHEHPGPPCGAPEIRLVLQASTVLLGSIWWIGWGRGMQMQMENFDIDRE